MLPSLRLFAALGASVAIVSSAPDVAAAEPWVERPMTPHRHVFAGDAGLGVMHQRITDPSARASGYEESRWGVGGNVEGVFGFTERLEGGLRLGLPAYYGIVPGRLARPMFTETHGGSRAFPMELHVRWGFYRGDVVEVGLDGRLNASFFGGPITSMLAVPVAIHLGRFARIDTGVYVPSKTPALSLPVHLWFQATDRVWLGPMSAVRVDDPFDDFRSVTFLVGVGAGWQLSSAVDLKASFLWQDVNDDFTRTLGGGVAVQVRFGE